MPLNRRDFLKSGVITAAATQAAPAAAQSAAGLRLPSQAGRGLKIACSAELWTAGGRASLAEALAGIAAAGYEWTEIQESHLAGRQNPTDELKRQLEKNNLGLITVALSGDFADREQRLQNISRAVLTARSLQGLGVGFLTLRGAWGSAPREPRNFQIYSRNLAEIGALVYEETGLHCAYHFQESEAADVRKLIATSDSRYVKFCFDTLSLLRLGIDPGPMIRAYAGRLVHVHLHDGVRQAGAWRDVPVGQGGIALAAVLDALCEIRYDGWATVEQEATQKSPAQDAQRSRQRIQSHLRGAIVPDGAPEPPLEPHHHDAARRGAIQQLVVLGATVSAGRALRPAAQKGSQSGGPMASVTRAMHGHRGRAAPPLPPKDPNFQPFFFTEQEYADVSALADAILPATETPGALDARADEYADLMIWLDQDHHQAARRQVERFRQLCSGRYQKHFRELAPAPRDEFLAYLSGKSVAPEDRPAADFFQRIRGLTVRAYYASPQGLLQELGYQGNTYLAEFKGCTHPEHKG